MPAFGSFALLVALALAGYNLLAGAVALRQLATGRRYAIAPERLAETARRAGIASFFATACAAFALVWAAFTNDFSVAYIAEHSNRALPTAYKFAALWSGQEGSLLLWAFLLAAYGFVLRVRHKVDVKLTAYASTILAGIQVFFLLLVNIAATPFSLVPGGVIPADGNGLNPLLQYPEMVIHPPMLYLGYVGFSVPFAFALGALMMRYPGEKWIHITRRWTMVTWLFLTVGIFLGMHWAYNVLGWGGYWGWDPVENASLMPWLTGTAFLHSVMMQEKRGMMKSWNVWLIFSTFMLSILGTLLTRSGLVSSVHAFAQSPIGNWFWIFLVITFAICMFTYIYNRDHLRTDHKLESLVSRESSFLFNNLVLLAACFTVLWGTFFPVLSEYVQGNKVTVSAPFYNRVAVPIGVFLLLLTGIGPVLAWRSTSMQEHPPQLHPPRASSGWSSPSPSSRSACIPGPSSPPIRKAPSTPGSPSRSPPSCSPRSLPSSTKARASSGKRPARTCWPPWSGSPAATPAATAATSSTSASCSSSSDIAGQAFNQSHEQTMNFKDSFVLGPYRVECLDYSQDSNPNYDTEFAMLNVYRGDKLVTKLAPELRVYAVNGQPSTIVANHSTLIEDLYVIYAGKDPATGQPVIKAFLNPLVAWIWIGLLVTILGTGIALVPNMSATVAAQRLRATEPAEPVAAGGAGN